jgi:hypothetical protein
MTPTEHTLIVHMFARQTLVINALVEILKSRDILQDDDVNAFEALARQTDQDMEIFHAVVSQYSRYAKELGLEGDLPKP